LTPVGGTPEEFTRYVQGELARWTKLAKEVGAVAD
ncbi:MAG: tripartite tricarboxylate transporter substrate binding protein, partial [Frateuria sp.]|nr:tripartite tricarboxylate transporter substrate binding protein [Frateuria sp.]